MAGYELSDMTDKYMNQGMSMLGPQILDAVGNMPGQVWGGIKNILSMPSNMASNSFTPSGLPSISPETKTPAYGLNSQNYPELSLMNGNSNNMPNVPDISGSPTIPKIPSALPSMAPQVRQPSYQVFGVPIDNIMKAFATGAAGGGESAQRVSKATLDTLHNDEHQNLLREQLAAKIPHYQAETQGLMNEMGELPPEIATRYGVPQGTTWQQLKAMKDLTSSRMSLKMFVKTDEQGNVVDYHTVNAADPQIELYMKQNGFIPEMVYRQTYEKNPASLMAFEKAYGLDPNQRGTPEYVTAYEKNRTLPAMAYGNMRNEIANLPRPTTTPGVTYSPKSGYESQSKTGERTRLSTEEVQKANIDFNAIKKNVMTYNGPTFVRLVNNAEILAKGTRNPYTGKISKPELDQLVDLRNKIDDGVFASISNKVKKFNDWDQFLKYQVSDPKVAAFKSKLMANVDTLANIYAAGGTVTSDFKMRFAQDLFDAGLNKGTFKIKMDTHKESVLDRAYKFSQPDARTLIMNLGPVQAAEFGDNRNISNLISKYFPPNEVQKALTIMNKESSGNPNAYHPDDGGKIGKDSNGLFQINDANLEELTQAGIISGKGDLYNPETNVRAAAYLQRKYGWGIWSTNNTAPGRAKPPAAAGKGRTITLKSGKVITVED